MKNLHIYLLFLAATAVPRQLPAEVHGTCEDCARLVVISETGFGFARDWIGKCGRCQLIEHFNEHIEEGEDPRDSLDTFGREIRFLEKNGIRYLTFEDGTMIDLTHFLAAAELGEQLESEVAANVIGWGWEMATQIIGNESGAPLGGNEDLRSNWEGADFGDDKITSDGPPLGEQVIDFLESRYGPLTGSSGTKPPKPYDENDDADDQVD